MKEENNICEKDESSSKNGYEQLEKCVSLLLALFLVLGLYDWRRKQTGRKAAFIDVEFVNANSKIELLEESERYELNDIFVVTTFSEVIFEKYVVNDLVTCKKYEIPKFSVANLGKIIFEKDDNNEYHNLISDFDYWGEETIFFSVKSGEVCGSMVEIYTNHNENPNIDVVAKYTQINFNGESQIIKTFTKAKYLTNYDFYNRGTSDFYITSLKDRLGYINKKEELKESQNRIYANYIKGDLSHNLYDSSNLFFTKLKDKLEYKNSLDSYTKEELIEIENKLNEKNKKLVLG